MLRARWCHAWLSTAALPQTAVVCCAHRGSRAPRAMHGYARSGRAAARVQSSRVPCAARQESGSAPCAHVVRVRRCALEVVSVGDGLDACSRRVFAGLVVGQDAAFRRPCCAIACTRAPVHSRHWCASAQASAQRTGAPSCGHQRAARDAAHVRSWDRRTLHIGCDGTASRTRNRSLMQAEVSHTELAPGRSFVAQHGGCAPDPNITQCTPSPPNAL